MALECEQLLLGFWCGPCHLPPNLHRPSRCKLQLNFGMDCDVAEGCNTVHAKIESGCCRMFKKEKKKKKQEGSNGN